MGTKDSSFLLMDSNDCFDFMYAQADLIESLARYTQCNFAGTVL